MNAITSATTKSELVEMLKKVSSKVKKADAKLAEEVKYATSMFAKDPSKVTKKDLLTLIAESNKALAIPASADTKKKDSTPAPTKEKPKASLKKKAEEPKVENLIKPAKKGADKKEEPKAEEKKKVPAKSPAKEKAEKKPTPAKKEEEKKPLQQTLEESRVKFADSITIETEEGDAEYKLAKGKFKDFKSLEKYLSDEDNPSILFVMPMTKQIAKEISYGCNVFPLPKDGFPDDLDVYIPVYVGVNNSTIILVSLYTDNSFALISNGNVDDVEEIDGIRYLGGLAYQIYVEA